MKVVINNKANVPQKYIRYIKRKLYRLKVKFKDLTKAEVFFNTIDSSSSLFNVHVNIESNNERLFISKADQNLDQIVKHIPARVQHTLNNKRF